MKPLITSTMIVRKDKTKELILGIDLGTGSLKTILLDLEGNPAGRSQAAYPTQSPQPGWAQQNPGDWVKALEAAIPSLLDESGVKAEQIRCIGLCGAAHIPVLLDRNDRPVYPAILWSDCRCVREVEHLETVFDEVITRRTTNKVACAWTLPQLLWIRNHIPGAIERTKTFLTSKDYLVYSLTGEKTCDTGYATSTMLYDPRAGEWAGELVDMTGLAERIFPQVHEPVHLVGETTSQALRFGLPSGIPVVAGCLDSVAEMVAVGGRSENDGVLRLGTAGAILTLGRNTGYKPGLYNYPFPDNGHSIFQAGTSSCGRSLGWIRDILSSPPGEIESVEKIPAGADGLFFHPFLHGERAPYFNPDLRGSFIGLTSNHRREHFLRAVLEGVAFSLLDCLNSIEQGNGLPGVIPVVGGGTRLPIWMSILANVLNRELLSLVYADSSFGSAVLAARHLLTPHETRQMVLRRKNSCMVYSPEPRLARLYGEQFQAYETIADFLGNFYRTAVDTAIGSQ